MKTIQFDKMQGTGNDYLYVDARNETIENPELLAVKISDRHFGVGSDGLVLIMNSVMADFKMRMFNADAGEGKMCGNAIRCVAKYLYDNMRPTPLEIICYHCRQSAEKALKAFLIHSKIKPEKTHDLESLRNECIKINESFVELEDECLRLNRYSSQPRYPMTIELTETDTNLALKYCKKISGFVKGKITEPDKRQPG